MGEGADGVAGQAMPPQLRGHEACRRSQLPPPPDHDVQRAGHAADPALPRDGQRVGGGIEGAGAGLVGDPIALLDDVERGPEVVGGDVTRDRAPRLGPDGGELTDQADGRTQTGPRVA